jgi:hypothetical protein
MSPEAQRIAIAEACGIVSKDKWGSLYKTPRGILRDCPDYLADLNAMHEAEKVLTVSQLPAYFHFLIKSVHPRNDPIGFDWVRIHATAAQRAEAFLRTLGKWEDAK